MIDAVAGRLSTAGAALAEAITDPAMKAHIQVVREVADAHLLRSFPRNTSGIVPTEFKVLILPKEVEEVTKGGIILAVETTNKEKWATIEGVLIARSPLAFTYANSDEWAAAGASPPAPGQRVLFAKYSGVRHKGKDGLEYVIANDKDILAVLDD